MKKNRLDIQDSIKNYPNRVTTFWYMLLSFCLMLLNFGGLKGQSLEASLSKKVYFQQQYNELVSVSSDNKSLSYILNEIQKKSNYVFIFTNDEIQADRKVNYSALNKPVDVILKELLTPLHVRFQIYGKRIVLSTPKSSFQKIEGINLLNIENYPQNISEIKLKPFEFNKTVVVSGKVVDENDIPLPGVNIYIKNTANATSTDGEGKFSIVAPEETSILIFSFIGYSSQEVIVGKQSSINIKLIPDVKSLSEVVVVGYGTQRKQDLSTAIVSVDSKALARQTVSGFDQALQGQAAGVQVTSPSGSPGSGINVRIRGNSSISLSNSPLYVIDGIPILPTYDQELSIGNQKPNPLNAINPSDIESIDVLKDGAAAAIYGSRAANGVVVITTKRGKTGKAQVTFNAFYSSQEIRKKIDVLNGKEFATLYNEGLVAGGKALAFNPDTVTTNTNWQDKLYRKAPIKSYQLSIRGGSEKTKYYISGSYFDQDGIIVNSGFKRYAAKLNLDQEVSSNFRVGTSLNLSRTDNNRSVKSELALNNSGVVLGALTQIPNMPVYNADGTYGLNPLSSTDNPVSLINEVHSKAIINQVIGNVYGELDILKNLKFKTTAGIDFRTQSENQFISREYSGTLKRDSYTRGSGATGANQETIWLLENTLTYKPKFGLNHDLTLLAGYSAQASDRFTSSSVVNGYPSDAVTYLSAGSISAQLPTSFADQWGLISYYFRAMYNYKDKYFATVSLREDGSSKFTSSNRFAFFPAVSLAWRVSEEAFFPKNNFLTDLKARASFGANGNQNIGPYDRFTSYGPGSNYAGNGGIVGGIAPNRVGNKDIKWETTYQYNVGLDFGFFDGRLTLTADAYIKRTKDLLLGRNLGYYTGASPLSVLMNLGQVENKGIELGINSSNIRSNGFSWTTQINFSLNRNKVIFIGSVINEKGETVADKQIYDYSIVQQGQPLGSFYGFAVKGIYQNADQVTKSPQQDNAKPGDIQFVDVNNDGKITGDDRKIIGNPNPKYFGGITNNFSYKGLELSVFFQGSFGNDIYNQNRTLSEGMMALPLNGTRNTLNRWTHEGQQTDMPRAVIGDPNNNNRVSTRFIEKGTYVRLKNLTLGYNIPSALVQRAKISSLRIYVSGQNLLTFTKYSGYDPEVSADPFSSTGFGRDFGVYPQAKTYTLGINVQF